MANPWFRFYAEFLHDPKVRVMSDSDQLRLVLLFCLRCNGSVTLQDKHVTFSLRISDAEWQKTKAVFVESGFIDSDNNVLNWDKRQYVSDSSASRVAKHRALHKPVTVTPRNVTVTPPEQNRTEQNRTEQKKPLSVKPDVIAIIDYLNLKAGRSYKAVDANAKFILSRLNEGATVDDMKRVIDKKVLEWGNDATMNKYLRPATLFNAEKFAQYSGETAKTQKPGKLNMEEWLKNV